MTNSWSRDGNRRCCAAVRLDCYEAVGLRIDRRSRSHYFFWGATAGVSDRCRDGGERSSSVGQRVRHETSFLQFGLNLKLQRKRFEATNNYLSSEVNNIFWACSVFALVWLLVIFAFSIYLRGKNKGQYSSYSCVVQTYVQTISISPKNIITGKQPHSICWHILRKYVGLQLSWSMRYATAVRQWNTPKAWMVKCANLRAALPPSPKVSLWHLTPGQWELFNFEWSVINQSCWWLFELWKDKFYLWVFL